MITKVDHVPTINISSSNCVMIQMWCIVNFLSNKEKKIKLIYRGKLSLLQSRFPSDKNGICACF